MAETFEEVTKGLAADFAALPGIPSVLEANGYTHLDETGKAGILGIQAIIGAEAADTALEATRTEYDDKKVGISWQTVNAVEQAKKAKDRKLAIFDIVYHSVLNNLVDLQPVSEIDASVSLHTSVEIGFHTATRYVNDLSIDQSLSRPLLRFRSKVAIAYIDQPTRNFQTILGL
jgi:hypothetical protein